MEDAELSMSSHSTVGSRSFSCKMVDQEYQVTIEV